MAGDWRYLVGRIVGDGTVDILETDLPIEITSVARNMSAPTSMSGKISHGLQRLKSGGRPIFEPWNTLVIAEADGLIRGMGIYRKPTFTGTDWALDIIGMSGYPQEMPFDGEAAYVDADPLDIFRDIWSHLQSQPHGNLGITIDSTTSPVRIGTPERDVNFTTGDGENVAFESGPRKLNWWTTFNLGREIDDLATSTPFDWREKAYWDADHQPHCHLELGYPILGERKTGPALVLGENIADIPSVTSGDYVNQVWTLGAGEGRDRVRGYAGVGEDKLRRIKVTENKKFQGKGDADAAARDALAAARGELIVEELTVYALRDRPLEGIEVGDELPLRAETDWVDLDTWVRVVGRADSPGRSDAAVLTVVRPGVV